MKNSTNEDNVTYIVFYEVYDYGDNGAYWEDRYYEFETYNELIEHCAEMLFRFGNEIRFQSIFKLNDNMLDLFSKDILKGVNDLREEEKEQKILMEKKLRKEHEEHEFALYKKLCRKYGNGEN